LPKGVGIGTLLQPKKGKFQIVGKECGGLNRPGEPRFLLRRKSGTPIKKGVAVFWEKKGDNVSEGGG